MSENKYDINQIAIDNIPTMITREWNVLCSEINKENIPGILFKLKDTYEIIAKIPTIMGLIIVSNEFTKEISYQGKTYAELENLFVNKDEMQNNSRRKKRNEETVMAKKHFSNLLRKMLEDPLSMGKWRELLEALIKSSKTFKIETALVELLYATKQLLYLNVNTYTDVVNWRNDIIGHGTLMIGDSTESRRNEYRNDINVLTKNLADYLANVNGIYKDLYFKIGDTRYVNNASNIVNSKSELKLCVGEKEYHISEYIYPEDGNLFFFDSYYSNKKKTKITDYINSAKFLENNNYFQELFLLYTALEKTEKHDKTVNAKYGLVKEREMLAYLNSNHTYICPDFIINDLKKMLEEYGRGVFLLQMERGMGKSALAHKMDGRYNNYIGEKVFNATVRVYHIRDIIIKGATDFYEQTDQNFLENSDQEKRIEVNSIRKDDIKLKLKNGEGNKNDFAELLEIYREIHEEEFGIENLIYIIDGIDELPSEYLSILDVIPSWDELKDGSYIIFTSRFENEPCISEVSKIAIRKVKEMLDLDEPEIITITNDDPRYIKLMKDYIFEYNKLLTESEQLEIIAKAQNRFLYIRPYMTFGDKIIDINSKEVADRYFRELLKYYYGERETELLLLVGIITLTGGISIESICRCFLWSNMTYDIIGMINDIMPLLEVTRNGNTNQYKFANIEFDNFVQEEYGTFVKEAEDRLILFVEELIEGENAKNYESAKDYIWENSSWSNLVIGNNSEQSFEKPLSNTTKRYLENNYMQYINNCIHKIKTRGTVIELLYGDFEKNMKKLELKYTNGAE